MYLNWPQCTKIIHQSDLSPVLGWSLQSLPIDQAAAHSNCGDLLGVVARPVNSHLCHGHSGSLGRRLPDPDSCAYKMVSICQYAYYWSQWYDPMGYYWMIWSNDIQHRMICYDHLWSNGILLIATAMDPMLVILSSNHVGTSSSEPEEPKNTGLRLSACTREEETWRHLVTASFDQRNNCCSIGPDRSSHVVSWYHVIICNNP